VKQRHLKRKFQKEKPDIMFVQETKCTNNNMENISKRLGKHIKYMEVASQDWEGGLVSIWDSKVINILSTEAARSYIAMETQMIGNSETYLCTNVYGPQKIEEKLSFLRSLLNLKLRHSSMMIIMGGDFNMIASLLEKKGGIRKLNKDAEVFAEFIGSAKLVDIQPKSGAFTGNNRREGEKQIASCLDRFLISEGILLERIIVESDILPSGGSDH